MVCLFLSIRISEFRFMLFLCNSALLAILLNWFYWEQRQFGAFDDWENICYFSTHRNIKHFRNSYVYTKHFFQTFWPIIFLFSSMWDCKTKVAHLFLSNKYFVFSKLQLIHQNECYDFNTRPPTIICIVYIKIFARFIPNFPCNHNISREFLLPWMLWVIAYRLLIQICTSILTKNQNLNRSFSSFNSAYMPINSLIAILSVVMATSLFVCLFQI